MKNCFKIVFFLLVAINSIAAESKVAQEIVVKLGENSSGKESTSKYTISSLVARGHLDIWRANGAGCQLDDIKQVSCNFGNESPNYLVRSVTQINCTVNNSKANSAYLYVSDKQSNFVNVYAWCE